MKRALVLVLVFVLVPVLILAACSGTTPGDALEVCDGITCSGHGTCVDVADVPSCRCDAGYLQDGPADCLPSPGPTIAGCPVLPVDHIFNTPIDTLPVHPLSEAFIKTIGGTRRLHLDLGRSTDQQAPDYYGIPYNIVNGASLSWTQVAYRSADPEHTWNARAESDCASGAARAVVSPCTVEEPLLPIPAIPVVEGGINRAPDQQPYGDHHLLILDADECRLWEAFHAYSPAAGTWNIYGSAMFDLRSNALRPADWTSSDAAGFPILPLLLRADEANSGEIRHALRFTIPSNKIRGAYTWPARHRTNGTSASSLPPMGQLFRLKADHAIPASFGRQARAILQAMKTYGMYIADGGSPMYVTGEPSASWDDETIGQVQSVAASHFEAVDLTPIMNRPGFDASSGAVPIASRRRPDMVRLAADHHP